MNAKHAVLVVAQCHTWCSACRKGVDPEQTHHLDEKGCKDSRHPNEVLGNGCEAEFVAISSGTWMYGPEDLAEIRSDLPVIPGDVVRIGGNQ